MQTIINNADLADAQRRLPPIDYRFLEFCYHWQALSCRVAETAHDKVPRIVREGPRSTAGTDALPPAATCSSPTIIRVNGPPYARAAEDAGYVPRLSRNAFSDFGKDRPVSDLTVMVSMVIVTLIALAERLIKIGARVIEHTACRASVSLSRE